MYISSPGDLESYQLQVTLQKTTIMISACSDPSHPPPPPYNALDCVLLIHYITQGYQGLLVSPTALFNSSF